MGLVRRWGRRDGVGVWVEIALGAGVGPGVEQDACYACMACKAGEEGTAAAASADQVQTLFAVSHWQTPMPVMALVQFFVVAEEQEQA